MKFDAIRKAVEGVPFITVQNAKYLYDLILREKCTRILELGIAHGTATCYMAAALDELGEGSITSVDLLETKLEFSPSPEDQLEKTGLGKFANVVRTKTGYTWFLHDEIQRLTQNDICRQEYDLCIIDGPKNWTIDGCAFFLCDKILKQNGWIIFDDYNWTYEAADKGREATDGVVHRSLSDSERKTPHVREIFELLVKQHPNYSEFFVSSAGDWAIARKVAADQKKYTIIHQASMQSVAVNLLASAKRRVKHLVEGKNAR